MEGVGLVKRGKMVMTDLKLLLTQEEIKAIAPHLKKSQFFRFSEVGAMRWQEIFASCTRDFFKRLHKSIYKYDYFPKIKEHVEHLILLYFADVDF